MSVEFIWLRAHAPFQISFTHSAFLKGQGSNQFNSIQIYSQNGTRCTFRIFFWGGGGGKPCPLAVALLLWKNGNFGRVGDKNMFKMYKKAGVGREGDI